MSGSSGSVFQSQSHPFQSSEFNAIYGQQSEPRSHGGIPLNSPALSNPAYHSSPGGFKHDGSNMFNGSYKTNGESALQINRRSDSFVYGTLPKGS